MQNDGCGEKLRAIEPESQTRAGRCQNHGCFLNQKINQYKMNKKNLKKQGGFTLIELLIVIGLLGALSVLILPSLSASREDALLDVCDYNQAGTARLLGQYVQFYGVLPSRLHTGLLADAAVDRANLMDMPTLGENPGGEVALAENFLRDGSAHTLTEDQATSLMEGGLADIAYDAYTLVAPAADVNVAIVTADWEDDGGAEYTFKGRSLADLGVDQNSSPDGVLIPFLIAPTVDWESGYGSVNDWAASADVQLKVDLEGACPIPANSDFTYYVAYVKAFNNGDPAILLGTSCPENGLLNP